jgi:hypothetical protein
MLYRILGLLIAAIITYTGWMCIGVPRFGPQLTGSFLLIVGLFLITLQLYLWWEQIMNNNPFDDEDIDEDRL